MGHRFTGTAAGGMQGLEESEGIMMEYLEQRTGDARRLVYDI